MSEKNGLMAVFQQTAMQEYKHNGGDAEAAAIAALSPQFAVRYVLVASNLKTISENQPVNLKTTEGGDAPNAMSLHDFLGKLLVQYMTKYLQERVK